MHMSEDLLQYRRSVQCTTILVTHHLHEALFLSDRVLVMGLSPGPWIGELPIRLPGPRDRATMRTPAYQGHMAQLLELLESGHRD